MPRLSIIIAAANESPSLEETLLAVLENRPEDCEVIVAHPSCYDDPYALDGEVRFVALPSTASQLDCIQAALAASAGDILHLLASGAVVEQGWTEEALVFFADRRVGSVAPLVMDRRDHMRIISAGIQYSRGGARQVCGAGQKWQEARAGEFSPLGPSLAAAFYRRSALDAAGGICPLVGERLVDIDIALALAAANYTSVLANESRVYCATTQRPARQSAFASGIAAERLFWRHSARARGTHAIVAHAAAITQETLFDPLRAPLRLAGRLWGLATLSRVPRVTPAERAPESRAGAPRTALNGWRRVDRPHSEKAVEREPGEQKRKAS